MPKSASLAPPSASTRTLAGVTSRWTTPCRCAASRVSSSPRPSRATRPVGSGPSRSTSSCSDGASTSSITSSGRPSCTSTSCSTTAPGWLNLAAARASPSTRSRSRVRSAAVADGGSHRSLIATSRPSSSSRARHTTPMPPLPSRSSSRYRPASRVPAAGAAAAAPLRTPCLLRQRTARTGSRAPSLACRVLPEGRHETMPVGVTSRRPAPRSRGGRAAGCRAGGTADGPADGLVVCPPPQVAHDDEPGAAPP
jgi:hypothetical protein